MISAPDRRVVPLVTGATLRPGARVRLDGYGHAWIAPPALAPADVEPMNDEAPLAQALRSFADTASPYRAALLDVQPQGCGRDAAALARLSHASGVAIAAVTGFHPPDHYPLGRRPWSTADAALATFQRELEGGMREQPLARPAAVAAALGDAPPDDDPCWDAALEACARSGSLLLVRTDGGAGVGELLPFLERRGHRAERAYICRIDDRPDAGLHAELASAGTLLGISGLVGADGAASHESLALVQHLLDAGHGASIALGLDLTEPSRWGLAGGSAGGPSALVDVVEPAVRALGASDEHVDALLGGNLLSRAARPEAPILGF